MSQENDELTTNDAIGQGLRLGLAAALGDTGFNDYTGDGPYRNFYQNFGWPKDDLDGWDEDNWLALYLRNGYAQVVNDKPAFATWRDDPEVSDRGSSEGEESEFEEQVEKLDRSLNLWSYAERVDRVSGIGTHGLLVLGLSDISGENAIDTFREDATNKFDSLDDLNQLRPILENQIEDIDWGGPDAGDRWGKPVSYTLDLSDDTSEETEDDPLASIKVHHSRVVDVPSTRLLDDETRARPRAEPVLNNLLDIEKTLGAVAEAAYMAADRGLHLNADPEKVDMGEGSDTLRDELEKYEHGYQRYLRTQGMEINTLGGDVKDPSGIVESNLDVISSVTGIPKKELRGNESGEVSGAEADTKSYFGMIAERREQYATPHIVRGLIDKLLQLGILTEPSGNGYTVEWADLAELDESDKAEIESNRANVVQAVPSLTGQTALEYVKNGASAIEIDTTSNDLEAFELDEASEQVQEEFNNLVSADD